MPLSFDFQGQGLDFEFDLDLHQKWKMKEDFCYLGVEKSSVLDTISSPLSSSLGSGGSGGAVETTPGKCGFGGGMEDWENVFSDLTTTSPKRDPAVNPYLMGDIDDPSMGLSKLLEGAGGLPEFDVSGGFGALCDGMDLGSIGGNFLDGMNSSNNGEIGNVIFPPLMNNFLPISQNHQNQYHNHQEQQPVKGVDDKSQIFNPQVMMINHHQAQPTQNPTLFLPFNFNHQDHQTLLLPPNPKRLNTRVYDLTDQIPRFPHHLQMLHHHQNMPTFSTPPFFKPKFEGEEITDQLCKAVEMIEIGNLILAQEILARLNHHLSPIGKPFHRVSFYIKESLNLLLRSNTNSSGSSSSSVNVSPFSIVDKIGAYKLFSEISPLVQFANFTCNQAILESLEGFDQIHIMDFDIGFGGQWASLMQELVLRNTGPPSLKITVFASPSTHDDVELELARENLTHFASEISMPFQLEIVNLKKFDTGQFHLSNSEAIAVNLPIGAFSNCPHLLPLVLRFVKQISPKVVVSLIKGSDRTDLPFAHHMLHALQFYSALLESIGAVNLNLDSLQKVEKFFIQPGIEQTLKNRHQVPEKTLPWKSLFLSSGFSSLPFSNFSESQGECIIQRNPVRGFHIEKRQSSLALCWQQNDLISVSAWRC